MLQDIYAEGPPHLNIAATLCYRLYAPSPCVRSMPIYAHKSSILWRSPLALLRGYSVPCAEISLTSSIISGTRFRFLPTTFAFICGFERRTEILSYSELFLQPFRYGQHPHPLLHCFFLRNKWRKINTAVIAIHPSTK